MGNDKRPPRWDEVCWRMNGAQVVMEHQATVTFWQLLRKGIIKPWGPELGESKTMDKWRLLYFPWPHDSPMWGVRVPSWLFQSPFEDHSQNWFRNFFQSQWSDPNFSAMTSWQNVSPGKRYCIPPKLLQAQLLFRTRTLGNSSSLLKTYRKHNILGEACPSSLRQAEFHLPICS